MTTLTFIAPSAILPRIVDQIALDLESSLLNSLTDFDYGVWQTPECEAFVDGRTQLHTFLISTDLRVSPRL